MVPLGMLYCWCGTCWAELVLCSSELLCDAVENLEGALRPRPVRITCRPSQTEVSHARNWKPSPGLALLHYRQLYNKKNGFRLQMLTLFAMRISVAF